MHKSTHTHLGTGKTVTVTVNYGTVRRETLKERIIRREGELPVMMGRQDQYGRRIK